MILDLSSPMPIYGPGLVSGVAFSLLVASLGFALLWRGHA